MPRINLDFVGPLTLVEGSNCLFHSPFAGSSGIYLWTIKQAADNTHLVHYVGETDSLGKRHKDHLIHILGLNYGIFDAEKAQRGVSELLWKGLWRDKTADGPSALVKAYGSIHADILRYLSVLNIFFAEFNGDNRLRKHLEGCIGWHLRNNHPEHRGLYPDDNHVGMMKYKINGDLLITTSETIRGIDPIISY